jgi:predicted 3-demethylubiquinone-9 3-methyltransferase (glyoxalase superfamily)
VQKITTFLTYDDRAEEAVKFYTSIFKNSRILSETRYGDAGPGPKGSLMTAEFELEGQRFVALNGGPSFKFEQGISLLIDCADQKEVDSFWERLSEGGSPGPCGWITDKFGVSWQVVPRALTEMLNDEDPAKADRTMKAMLQMGKLDIAQLKEAYEGQAEESSSRR